MKVKEKMMISLVVGLLITAISGFVIKVPINVYWGEKKPELTCYEHGPFLTVEQEIEYIDRDLHGVPFVYVSGYESQYCDNERDIDFTFFAIDTLIWTIIVFGGWEVYRKMKDKKEKNV